jgi:hypothetical protein
LNVSSNSYCDRNLNGDSNRHDYPWVANAGGTITELVGVATPVLTPMAACLTKTPPATVCLP